MTNQTIPDSLPQIFTRKTVEQITSKSRTSIYRDMAAGTFPKNISLGGSRVGWLKSDILGWVESRIAASKAAQK
ncbi:MULTISPECIES: helix-turn-helix transcriptional regulator [Deefgea]|uniref:AlpA family phage regulatory protein n=1 Tax=Deefgea chitinilytica TaxID=570276 RepID=A0ABS2CBX7_9NEIS|nr:MULTISPECIES: AlpA family phage regulatory protein [Deefgea]MBM5571537.1 AlpA family phage regulatory protein [Deefgea chitinilytica]MBM9888770.1 AlpA family phage regulatory protein [Deefgea sp. CFH1-16]